MHKRLSGVNGRRPAPTGVSFAGDGAVTMTSRTCQVHLAETDIHVVKDGAPNAPGLLLFSGARCNTGMWEPVLPPLSSRFHVIRHDVRGTGHSKLKPDAPLGLDYCADDAVAVLDELGVDQCAVWGMAFGSRVALAFAARHPDRVSRLALFDASVEAPDWQAQQQSMRNAREARQRLQIPEIQLNNCWFDHDSPETLAAVLRASFAQGDHQRYAHRVTAPTLIATGELDPNLGASRRLQRIIPGSRLTVLEATGHGSVLQRPDLCLSVVLPFLDQGVAV